jgi:large subunit ribosomal protein L17e
MFGLKHARGASESDDEDDDDMDNDVNEMMNDRNPAIMLRPVSRIIGFDK